MLSESSLTELHPQLSQIVVVVVVVVLVEHTVSLKCWYEINVF